MLSNHCLPTQTSLHNEDGAEPVSAAAPNPSAKLLGGHSVRINSIMHGDAPSVEGSNPRNYLLFIASFLKLMLDTTETPDPIQGIRVVCKCDTTHPSVSTRRLAGPSIVGSTRDGEAHSLFPLA